MRKLFIILGVVVVVIVVALVIAFFNLEGLINKNKDTLLAKAEETVGREITLGDVGLSFKGGLGVVLNDVTLADDPAFSDQPLVSAKSLQVNAKIMPLFRKEFQVKRVILREPVFNLVRDEQGVLNATTLAAGGEQTTSSNEAAAAPLVVSLVNISDGVVHFEDRAQAIKLDVTDIDSKVTDFEMGKPISLELDAAVIEPEKNFALAGTFGPLGDNPDDTPVDARVGIGPIAFATLSRAVPALTEGMPPELSLSGPITLNVEAKGTVGDLALKIDLDANDLAAEMPASFVKTAGTPLSLSTDIALTKEHAKLANTAIKLHSLELAGSGDIALGEVPTARIKVESQPTDLAGWSEILPALAEYGMGGTVQLGAVIDGPLGPEQKPAVNGRVKLANVNLQLPEAPKPINDINADVSFTDTSASLKNTSLRIGSSTITANANVSSFEPLVVEYTAGSSALALNDVRPAPKPGEPGPKPTKRPEVVRDLNVAGSLKVVGEQRSGAGKIQSGSGSVADIDYTQLSGDFKLDGDRLDVSDIVVSLLDGKVKGDGTFMIGDEPSFELSTEAQQINVVGVMEMIPDVARSHLRGTTNFNLTVSGEGKEWSDIQPTVSGNGFAELMDGALVDINIAKAIVDEITANTGLSNLISQRIQDKYPKAFKDRDTAFEELKSTFVIEDGKLLVRNMNVAADDYGFHGVGAIDFNKGLNLDVTMTVSKALTDDIARDFAAIKYLSNDKGQIEVPFYLQGVLPKVSVKPNQDYINGVVQNALVNEGLNNLLKDQRLQDGIRDLFKKKKD